MIENCFSHFLKRLIFDVDASERPETNYDFQLGLHVWHNLHFRTCFEHISETNKFRGMIIDTDTP